jgi:hypothetical protein
MYKGLTGKSPTPEELEECKRLLKDHQNNGKSTD